MVALCCKLLADGSIVTYKHAGIKPSGLLGAGMVKGGGHLPGDLVVINRKKNN